MSANSAMARLCSEVRDPRLVINPVRIAAAAKALARCDGERRGANFIDVYVEQNWRAFERDAFKAIVAAAGAVA